jgi:hypothetical protein
MSKRPGYGGGNRVSARLAVDATFGLRLQAVLPAMAHFLSDPDGDRRILRAIRAAMRRNHSSVGCMGNHFTTRDIRA